MMLQVLAVWFEHENAFLQLREGVLFGYRPSRGVILRLQNADKISIERAKLAAKITGVPLTISLQSEESDTNFISRLPNLRQRTEFLRTIEAPRDEILRAVHAQRARGIALLAARAKPFANAPFLWANIAMAADCAANLNCIKCAASTCRALSEITEN